VAWDVEFTDEFGSWWETLDEDAQTSINAVVLVLDKIGPALTRPYADTLKGSRHPNMRELRVQHQGRPFRLLYAFDPRRTAIILIGGDKVETIGGTTCTFRSPTNFTTNTCKRSQTKPTRRRCNDMARKFNELRAKMSPAAQVKSQVMAQEILAQLPLQELRRAREYSQQTLADAMGVPQSAISKIERRTDSYISTLRKYLHAMGGELEIIAAFPDGTRVEIEQFQDIGEPSPDLVDA
jgi:DNA-binding XRE family transcriptional regulator